MHDMLDWASQGAKADEATSPGAAGCAAGEVKGCVLGGAAVSMVFKCEATPLILMYVDDRSKVATPPPYLVSFLVGF